MAAARGSSSRCRNARTSARNARSSSFNKKSMRKPLNVRHAYPVGQAADFALYQMQVAVAHRRKLEARAPHIGVIQLGRDQAHLARSEEHTSELQSLMRISYAVLCLKKN